MTEALDDDVARWRGVRAAAQAILADIDAGRDANWDASQVVVLRAEIEILTARIERAEQALRGG